MEHERISNLKKQYQMINIMSNIPECSKDYLNNIFNKTIDKLNNNLSKNINIIKYAQNFSIKISNLGNGDMLLIESFAYCDLFKQIIANNFPNYEFTYEENVLIFDSIDECVVKYYLKIVKKSKKK